MSRTAAAGGARLRLTLRGAVQGVGFRPFVFRLAAELGLAGWVRNGPAGLACEVEGPSPAVSAFLERLVRERPRRAVITSLEQAHLDPVGYGRFEIRESEAGGAPAALVLPDLATCGDCLREIRDPRDRRHRYPFTNCTNCGPRYTVIESLPYDRPRTTMKAFPLCRACREEYEDPADRRFHAQPMACPDCGPQLALLDPDGAGRERRDPALRETVRAIREGAVVAVKGVGGFHLLVDARNEEAVRRLRERKGREEKPFALLYPSLDLARAHARVGPLEALLLASAEAPIVLLPRRSDDLALSVAPRSPSLGIMLPSNPLHHLLAAEFAAPLVATSGNRCDEPIAADNGEALARLGGIADLFLVHDRPIARPLDDSIVRVAAGRPLLLRRARGYAPLPIALPRPLRPVLAVGAQVKGAVAIAVGGDLFLSQHLGDLGSTPAAENFEQAVTDLSRLYDFRPAVVARDLHPDYRSTRYAESLALPAVAVQHHHAHVLSCMADNEIDPPVLGVAWDGTGYGPDGTVWGGEFLRVTGAGAERVAHLRTFLLPGGEKAVAEPRRAALGVLYEIWGADLPGDLALLRGFTRTELHAMLSMLDRGVNSPRTSSAGRLFDAVAALLGIRYRATYEGQAALELEGSAEGWETEEAYEDSSPDWGPLVRRIVADLRRGEAAGRIAAKFHASLIEGIVAVARQAGEERVVLTGGCFQNRILTERAVRRLGEEGFRPYWHQRVPPNDGGIALGQALAAGR